MDDQELDTYHRFIAVLKTGDTNSIPHATVFGAITHYLSTLALDEIPAFLDAILQAHMSGPSTGDNSLREAVFLAPSTKLSHIETALLGSWLPRQRTARQMSQWYQTVSRALAAAEASGRRLDCMLGLLKGAKSDERLGRMISRSMTGSLQEGIVLSVAELRDQGDLRAFTGALDYVADALDDTYIRTLDVKTLLTAHRQALFRILSTDDSVELSAQHTKIMTRYFDVLDRGGPSSRQHAWTEMRVLLADFGSFIVSKDGRSLPLLSKDGASSCYPPWTTTATTVSFLELGQSMMGALQRSDPPASVLEPIYHPVNSPTVPEQILVILSLLTDSLERSSKMSPAYYELLNQCLDHVAAKGDTATVHRLFEHVFKSAITPERSAFILITARELLPCMSGRTIRGLILPVCQENLLRHQQHSAFEASHAFVLAVLETINARNADLEQQAVIEELAMYYAALVLKQGRQDHLPSDEVVRSYSVTCSAIGHTNPSALQKCIDLLPHTARDKQFPFDQTIRLCFIAATPSLPSAMLANHLDHVVELILEVDSGTKERSDLVAAVYGMITRDLPDSTRRQGVEWWMRNSRTLIGDDLTTALRARL